MSVCSLHVSGPNISKTVGDREPPGDPSADCHEILHGDRKLLLIFRLSQSYRIVRLAKSRLNFAQVYMYLQCAVTMQLRIDFGIAMIRVLNLIIDSCHPLYYTAQM